MQSGLLMLQVACHKWSQAFAISMNARLGINHIDDTALIEEVLLEPSSLAVNVEKAPCPSPDAASAGDAAQQQNAQPLPLSVSEELLGLPRLAPTAEGLAVQMRWVL